MIEIAAVAVGTWGNGEPGGNVLSWVDLTVPKCGKTEDWPVHRRRQPGQGR